jgi:hypothetical protein
MNMRSTSGPSAGRRMIARQFSAVLFLLGIVCAMAPADARKPIPLGNSTPVCPAGMHVCAGTFGNQCYSPASGQVCNNGMVCATGQQVCSGPWGASCYSPVAGQHCQLGLVCGPGQSICTAGGAPRCYTPASGERCQ